MKHIVLTITAGVLFCTTLAAAGCACGTYKNEIVEQTPNPSATQDMQNTPAPQNTQEKENIGSYNFSWLQQDADGTTTDVIEEACTLHYNADMFLLDETQSNEYMAAFTTNGALGVDYITARIVRAQTELGAIADCFDYYNLETQDGAETDDLETLDTKIGRVTYYVTTSDLEGDGQSVRAYYAINLGQVAFCGTMDIALDAEAMLLDDRLLREYAEEFFDEGIADVVFENLFMEVRKNEQTQIVS